MRAPPIVLVVEDNAELRHVLKEALGSEGYAVLAARDDTEALELLRANQVSLFIADLTEPPQDSPALDEVRKQFPELPIVALADGTGSHPVLFFGAWNQPKGYRTLSKPFRLGELLAVSREVLGSPG